LRIQSSTLVDLIELASCSFPNLRGSFKLIFAGRRGGRGLGVDEDEEAYAQPEVGGGVHLQGRAGQA